MIFYQKTLLYSEKVKFMNKEYMLSDYTVIHHSFKNVHSIGPEIFFNNPCIGYLKRGCAKFLYNGKTFYAKEGDLIYIAYETKYQSIWYGSPEVEWYLISFDFASKFSFYDYRFQILKNYPSEIPDKIFETYDESKLCSVSYFYMLLDDIYKKMQSSPSTKSRSSIEPAINYIENNYNKIISIEALAELCHMSKSTLFAQFKRVFGVTPVAYKHNVMIQHAIDLLSNKDMSIEKVSREVGFSSSNYFRKIFIKLTNKKPKEIRKG